MFPWPSALPSDNSGAKRCDLSILHFSGARARARTYTRATCIEARAFTSLSHTRRAASLIHARESGRYSVYVYSVPPFPRPYMNPGFSLISPYVARTRCALEFRLTHCAKYHACMPRFPGFFWGVLLVAFSGRREQASCYESQNLHSSREIRPPRLFPSRYQSTKTYFYFGSSPIGLHSITT